MLNENNVLGKLKVISGQVKVDLNDMDIRYGERNQTVGGGKYINELSSGRNRKYDISKVKYINVHHRKI